MVEDGPAQGVVARGGAQVGGLFAKDPLKGLMIVGSGHRVQLVAAQEADDIGTLWQRLGELWVQQQGGAGESRDIQVGEVPSEKRDGAPIGIEAAHVLHFARDVDVHGQNRLSPAQNFAPLAGVQREGLALHPACGRDRKARDAFRGDAEICRNNPSGEAS